MVFCPNCFSTDGYDENGCRSCGYRDTGKRSGRALREGILLRQRYLVGRVLGIGGFGITYLCLDKQQNARCAVKEYFPSEWSVRGQDDLTIIPREDRRSYYDHGRRVFIDEANLLFGLRDERAIVDVWDMFEENATTYMVMEYLEGETVSAYMKNHRRALTLDKAGVMLREIAQALLHIHDAMLLHRDISPDNIIWTKKNKTTTSPMTEDDQAFFDHFKLIDFGSTRAYALDSPNSFSVMVKPGFAPIEQYSKQGKQGPWSDIYSLAATYYYAVSGKKIPSAPDRELGELVTPLKEYVPTLSDSIERAIMHALATDLKYRTQNMRDFMREIGFDVPEPARPKPMLKPHLRMEQAGHTGAGERFDFVQGKLTIGRNPGVNEICINDRQISGQHCTVWFDGKRQGFYILDHSTNGTFTAKGRIENGKSVRIEPGDWFYLQTGSGRYRFHLEV